MRKTKQRQVIVEELAKLRTHPSAAELYGLVRKRLPRISLGTVYRNLDLLAREGTIGRLDGAGFPHRFDGAQEAHRHIRCVRCGRVDDLPGCAPERRGGRDVAKGTGYRVTGCRVEYVGICPSCRGKGRDR